MNSKAKQDLDADQNRQGESTTSLQTHYSTEKLLLRILMQVCVYVPAAPLSWL